MRGDRDDVSARPSGPGTAALRTVGLAGGFCLSVAATVAVLLTEDPQVLRLAVVAAAWAFVLAALVASRRTADGAPVDGAARAAVERADLERTAAEREAELRLAYELELEREVAARREHELRVENDLRRTAEQSMRTELEALRTELAQVAELRRDLTGLAELRRDVAGLAELRRDVAGLAELRTALAGLDLTGLAELRTDVGRLRSELTEQLSGEMLVERVMLRTQSTRTAPAAPEPTALPTVEADGWDRPASEPTAAWPAVRADEPAPGTRRLEEVRVEPRPTAPPQPLDWLARRSLLDVPPPTPQPEPEPEWRRRRTDDLLPGAPLAGQLTVERPVARRERPPVPGPAAPAPVAAAPAPAEEDSARRPAELVAESGLTPPSGGRRRRRYREDGESDDVLARVLGRG
ncbi:DUF6779 domain-containing protein [Geodermatophilus poikilotrophus]|nr:DUF6779 domain-containing protein [Geodermatophilus poikilotrophus]